MALENAVVVSSDAPDVSVQIGAASTTTMAPTESTDSSTPQRDETGRFVSSPVNADDAAGAQTTAPEPDATAEPPAKPEKRASPQKRIDQAIWRQREAERRADDLAARLETLESGRAAPDRATPPPQQVTPPTDPDPRPTEDQHERYEDYIEALTEWKTRRTIAADFAARRQYEQEQHVERTQQAVLAGHAARVAEAKTLYPDWEETVSREDVPVTAPMEDAILHSPIGHHLMYYLGEHPEIATWVSQQPPGPALIAMGKLEAHLEAAFSGPAPSVPAPTTPPVPLSRTPPPIQPVTGGVHVSSRDLASLPLKEYMRVRQEQINMRRT